MFPLGLLLDGLVALLLVVTVIYCYQLNSRLRALRSGQDGLKDLIRGLNTATERAQAGIAQLKVAGDAAGNELKESITRARAMADELSLMIEAGNNIADRLEGHAASGSGAPKVTVGLSGAPQNGQASGGGAHQNALNQLEGEMLKALREAR